MYLQSGIPLPVVNVRQMIEIHHLRRFMEEQHYLRTHDPCKSIRNLAMTDQEELRRQQAEKPLTAFSIRDILSEQNVDKKTVNNETNTDSELDRCRTNNFPPSPTSSASEVTDSIDSRLSCKAPSKILHKSLTNGRKIVRPWSSTPKPMTGNCERLTNTRINMTRDYSDSSNSSRRKSSNFDPDTDEEEEIDVEGCDDDGSDISMSGNERDISPLDALVAMSSKAFVGLENFENHRNNEEEHENKSQIPKKKRKTRTAFTNQQIYELEKRFILQKYLTPADRDEIASKLGLTCAQVITWFQNRRAKFKRDIEEMKNDVVATSPKRTETCSESLD